MRKPTKKGSNRNPWEGLETLFSANASSGMFRSLPMSKRKWTKLPEELRIQTQEARALGVPALWYAGEDFEIKNDILKIHHGKPKARLYFPIADNSLPGELARLYTGGSIDEFTKHFGGLGYSYLVEPQKRVGGDPTKWIRAHARTVHVCLDLIGKIYHGESDEIHSTLETLKPSPFARGASIVRLGGHYTVYWPVDPARCALILLNDLITPNIAGVTRYISHDDRKTFFKFRAMIEVVYWQLANAIDGGGVRRCQNPSCSQYFIAKDKREKYCPPPDALTKSRCASKFNFAKYYASNREEHNRKRRERRATMARKRKKTRGMK